MNQVTTQPSLELLRSSDQALVENLWQCYQHDLSEFRGSLPGPDGRYKNSRIATYLNSPDRSAYLISVEGPPPASSWSENTTRAVASWASSSWSGRCVDKAWVAPSPPR